MQQLHHPTLQGLAVHNPFCSRGAAALAARKCCRDRPQRCYPRGARVGENQIAADEAYGCSRRSALGLLSAAAAAAVWPAAQPAVAAATADEQLPKGYQELSSRLVKALREAIETDLGEATESEVRRKADAAKGLVREWMINWRDKPMVSGSDSHRELGVTIQELGTFYTKNGQRARMSSSAGASLLGHLDSAAVTLPP